MYACMQACVRAFNVRHGSACLSVVALAIGSEVAAADDLVLRACYDIFWRENAYVVDDDESGIESRH
jgi:hypothetical protein